MKCEKCNYEIQDDDLYCTNCGAKIERKEISNTTQTVSNEKTELETTEVKEAKSTIYSHRPSNKDNKKMYMILSVIIGVVVLIGIVFFVLNQPKDINIEVGELISSRDIQKYDNDRLFVHGYLMRIDDEKNKYALINNKEDYNTYLIFTYDKGLSEDIGSNSELTVIGNLSEFKEDDKIVLYAEDVQIQKREENIIDVEDTTTLLKNQEKYFDKKITVTGKLVITNGNGVYITDKKIVNSIWLYGVSVQEALKYVNEVGSWCTITGTFFKDDNGSNAIQYESFNQNSITAALNEEDITNSQFSVNEVLNKPEKFLDKKIAVYGSLPQSITLDHSGNPNTVIFNENSDNFIVLKGKSINFGGCHAVVKGTLTSNGIDLILDVEDYYRP